MRKAYTLAEQQEAVALARVAGAELAADQLGMDVRTVRGWLAKAGDRPELDGSASQWRDALQLAQAKLSARLASGKVTAVQLATIAGIAERNLRAIEARNADSGEGPSAVAVFEALDDWIIDEIIDPADLTNDAAFDEHHDAMNDVHAELLGRANAQPQQPHRPSFLAWHRESFQVAHGLPVAHPQFPASPDLLEWCQAHIAEIVMEHGGSLVPAIAEVRQERDDTYRVDADRHESVAARVRYCIENTGLSVAECITQAQQPLELDADALPVLELAEAYLAEASGA